MSAGKKIFAAYGTSLLGIISGLLTNFWLLREIARGVYPDDFGLYAFALQITAYLAIFQIGLDFAVSREIAVALGRGDPAGAKRAYLELKRFNRLGGLISLLATVVITGALLFTVKGGNHSRLAAEIAMLAGLSQVLSFWTRAALAALNGSQLMALSNVTNVISSITTSVLAYLLLKLGWGVLCLPAAGLVVQGANWACLSLLRDRHCGWMHVDAAERDPKLLSALLKYSLVMTLGGIGWTIESTCDVFILKSVCGTEAVAAYVLWWRFPQLLFSACSSLSSSAFPSFAHRLGGPVENSSELIAKILWLQIGLGTMALLGISVWLPGFTHIWLAGKYGIENAVPVALGMGLLVCLRAYGNLLGMVWLATGQARLPATLSWIQAGLKILLAVWWVSAFGLVGVVVASCCTMFIQCAVLGIALYQQRLLAVKLGLLATLVPAAAILLAAGVAGNFLNPSLEFLTLGIGTTLLIWGAFWFALAWRGALGPNLRHWIRLQPIGA